MQYYHKYLKYKSKYLSLKKNNLLGGYKNKESKYNNTMANQIKINFIFTFKNRPQEMADAFFDKNISEIDFMLKVFSIFSFTKSQLRDLIKISTLQYTDKEHALLFLLKRNGKYFFNVHVNHDPDTVFWRKFKNDYVKNM